MSLCNLALISIAFAQLLGPSNAVPNFDIDLDQPPAKRWLKVVEHYKEEMKAMGRAVKPTLAEHLGKDRDTWAKAVPFGAEYDSELQGMVTAVNDPEVTLNTAKLLNMLYEIQSPTACSGVLWAAPDGTVMHGRNMDYSFHFKMPDERVLNWPDVTFDATFHKAGQRLFKITTWPWQVGMHTGMRFGPDGGWSFQQNTRKVQNEWHENLKAAKAGGQVFMLAARKVMETTPHFTDAVSKLNATKFMAPSYFIMSGSRPFEGAVLTVDRLGKHSSETPFMTKVGSSGDAWHIVQTNDDLLAKPLDQRRPIANYMLSGATQRIISEEHLTQFMHTSPMSWSKDGDGTVFTTVMVPSRNYFKTVLPNELPGPIAKELFDKASAAAPSIPASAKFLQRHSSLSAHI